MLPAPPYQPPVSLGGLAALMVEDMRHHTSDEGYQLALALERGGYTLFGHNFPGDRTDVSEIIENYKPKTLVLQDKREWVNMTAGRGQDPACRFRNVQVLKDRYDIFKVTVLKDAQNNNKFHSDSAEEIGCHAWITYYHEKSILPVAPFLRKQHLIRTYHTIDAEACPVIDPRLKRQGCLLSGANSRVYPLRRRLIINHMNLPSTDYLPHPGYHRRGTATPDFLQLLQHYKVAICTSSKYGYALRKIIEASACGCIVVTDLPAYDKLPFIEKNLVRVKPTISLHAMKNLLHDLYNQYDYDKQADIAEKTRLFYDYRLMGAVLAKQIEDMRKRYAAYC